MIRPTICLLLLMTLALASDNNAEKLLAKATNDFTSKMFFEVGKSEPEKNLVISAFSVMPALAQLAIASVGESHDELLRSIGVTDNIETKAVFSHHSINSLIGSTKNIEFKMANKIYISKNYELNSDFSAVSRDIFKSDISKLDFVNSVDSAEEINLWVQNQTNNCITGLVSPDMIDADTQAVLVNTLYFKGAWKYPFNKLSTNPSDFSVTKDKVIQVPTMYASKQYRYAEWSPELNSQVIEVPYDSEDASMVIVLPKEVDGVVELQNKLTDPSVLENVYRNMTETKVDLYLPTFKIETTTNLKDVLENMNVKKIFNPSQAGLSNFLQGSRSVHVTDALQKAFIEVTEEGAEGAAANILRGVAKSAITRRRPEFRANKPFYFVIKIKSVPLFCGVLKTP